MTEWKYVERDDYDKEFTDKKGSEWKYISEKSARQKKLTDAYEVIGNLDISKQDYGAYGVGKDGNILHFCEPKSLNRMKYSTKGYMMCDKDDGKLIRVIEKSNKLTILLTAAALLLIATGIYFGINSREQGPALEDEAIAYKMPEGTSANDDESKIMIPGYGELPMQADTDELYAALINPEGNKCYFRYQIILKDENKTVYESKLIKPGMAVTNVRLNQKMKSGVYDIKIAIQAYDLDDYEKQLNGGVVETSLIVK